MTVSSRTSKGASAAAIRSHYDVGNDFFELWLDPSMSYSCALWEEGDDLERAQYNKIRFHLDALAVDSSTRLLDVGCGWGSVLRSACSDYNVKSVEGLTLSNAQVDFVRAMDIPRCNVGVQDWRDHDPSEPYDAIVSIGAMEHFATMGLGRAQRVQEYGRFFDSCASWLTDRGRLSLQTIAFDRADEDSLGPVGDFISTSVFPESTLPTIAEITEACEDAFSVRGVWFHGDHYAKTCGEWKRRLRSKKREAIALYGEETYETYLRFLTVTQALFRFRNWDLLRIVLEKR